MSVQIRKFTPSLLAGDTLEQLYVERNEVLSEIVRRVHATRNGAGVSHVLVMGPRGAGKTHLISLVHHRLRAHDLSMPITWLVEDPYDILSFHDLLAAIVDRATPAITPMGTSTEHLEQAILARARETGPIVVLAENFDEILEQIGELDQQRLRRLIESERSLQLVVTTTAISKDLADQPAPFYGFFNHVRLEPFTTDQALEYLVNRAEVQGDVDFANQLTNPDHQSMAQRRIQSIEQLAGGQPRIWALLAEGLTLERLDEMVRYMIDNFDDITPYYQSQLRQLAPLQRRLVLMMVRQDRALTAKDLDGLIDDATATTITKTLRDLHARGWVQPVDSPLLQFVDGRVTYYELAEPLLRLALELKDNSRHEIGMILDFVKLWFDPSETEQEPVNIYAQRAIIERGPDDTHTATRWMLGLATADTPSLRMLGALFDATYDLTAGRGEQALALSNIVRHALESRLGDDPSDVVPVLMMLSEAASRDAGLYPTAETAEWLARHREFHEVSGAKMSRSGQLLARWLATNWEFEAAHVAIDQLSDKHPDTLATRHKLASSYHSAGRTAEAITLNEHVLADRIETLGDKHPNTLTTRNNLAHSYWSAGRTDEAITLNEHVLADRIETLGDKHPNTLNTRNNLAHSYWSAGRTDEAITLQEHVLADLIETLGDKHPDTLNTRNNLAHSYWSAGRTDEAITLQEHVLADRIETLGDKHPDTLNTRNNLAHSYHSAGRTAEAITLQEHVLADLIETLGDKHPNTLNTRASLEAWRSR